MGGRGYASKGGTQGAGTPSNSNLSYNAIDKLNNSGLSEFCKVLVSLTMSMLSILKITTQM